MDIVQSRRTAMARSGMSRISQETIAIIGATITLAALILTSSAGIRGEIHDIRSDIRDIRAEARADRETFQSHILRLTEQQGVLSTRLDGLRDSPASNR